MVLLLHAVLITVHASKMRKMAANLTPEGIAELCEKALAYKGDDPNVDLLAQGGEGVEDPEDLPPPLKPKELELEVKITEADLKDVFEQLQLEAVAKGERHANEDPLSPASIFGLFMEGYCDGPSPDNPAEEYKWHFRDVYVSGGEILDPIQLRQAAEDGLGNVSFRNKHIIKTRFVVPEEQPCYFKLGMSLDPSYNVVAYFAGFKKELSDVIKTKRGRRRKRMKTDRYEAYSLGEIVYSYNDGSKMVRGTGSLSDEVDEEGVRLWQINPQEGEQFAPQAGENVIRDLDLHVLPNTF